MISRNRWLTLALFLHPTGCESVESTAPGPVFASEDVTTLLTSHPESPRVFAFTGFGRVHANWEGAFRDATLAAFEVETLSSTRRAEMLHLVQVWKLYPPDPFRLVRLRFEGTLDLASGRLVLSGSTADGRHAQALVKLIVDARGSRSLSGELIFVP